MKQRQSMGGVWLLILMLLTANGFYDSDSVQILLNHLIQSVIRIKYTFKIRMYMLRQPDQNKSKYQNGCQKDQGNLHIKSE